MVPEAARYIGAAVAIFALYGIGTSMGNLFSAWMSAVARNPEADEKIKFAGMLGFAITESIALCALLVAILILFR
ncbi:MAG: F0F1 ATP synthase subunit C [Holosporaceae bacterium]|jgi:F0F1-type ATP synthase membrane subunit c/vacuolar-type H+-ATPase subunit K|nr:F0F1 ATP synthase subunit C [Holosporaceae bacterium]